MTGKPYVVTVDGHDERYETEEDVSKAVAQYQMEHPDDPDFTGMSVRRADGEPLSPQRLLPPQLP